MSGASTVASLLAAQRAAGVDRLDAYLLLGHAMRRSRVWLLAHDDAAVEAAQADAAVALTARRAAGWPLAYLVGEQEFHGLALRVDPSVLIPRPDTEVLVDWAIELLADWPASHASAVPAVVDLGTGSGAVALAVKHACGDAAVTASDISAEALSTARSNAERLGLTMSFVEGAWWRAFADRRFDLALSNPPYIADGDPHLPALRHEPALALTPGGDGMAALREIVAGAPAHLAPGGWLLLEHGHDQAASVRAMLAARRFTGIATRPDIAGRDRCTGGRLQTPSA